MVLTPRSPNLNSHMESIFFGPLKAESLSRMIFFGETSMRRTVREFLADYHSERSHQGIGNRLIELDATVESIDGAIECHERLGGMLKFYYRRAV